MSTNVVRAKNDRSPGFPGGFVAWIRQRLPVSLRIVAADRRDMRLMETLPLGGRRTLMLVECRAQHYLIASSAERIEIMIPIDADRAEVAR